MITDTEQNAIGKITGSVHNNDRATPYVAKVIKVNSDRNTVDLKTSAGIVVRNVPVKTRAGLIEDEVYGELDLPEVGNSVIVSFLQNRESHPFVDGTVIPYLNSKYQSNQVPVNSSNKAYTLKLLETGMERVYRKIFKGGTTIEVQDDGTIIIETPSGAYIMMDEAAEEIIIEDSNGNDISMITGKVTINGNLEILQ
jgi:hypothetical protein